METKCIIIRQALKTAIKNNYFSRDLIDRLNSLRGMILRMIQTSLQAVWIDYILTNVKAFISLMSSSPANIVDSKLELLEKEVMGALLTGLSIPPVNFERIYSQVINQCRGKPQLSEILPKFLGHYLKLTINNQFLAKNDFELNISPIFICFQVPYNFYVEGIANKHFGNSLNYDMSKLDDFLSFFFGSLENYKFYVKIARIVEPFKMNIEKKFFPYDYNITLTVLSRQYTGIMNTLVQGQAFPISPIGIVAQNSRKDNLVIFGRHPESDIVFPPDEKMIDYVALIFLNFSDNVYAIDVSKKANIGMKLEEKKLYLLLKGSLINIAKTQTFHIEDIKMNSGVEDAGESPFSYVYEDDNAVVDSHVILDFIEGSYQGNKFSLTTKTRDPCNKKLVHTFGCGGGGESPDFFIPRESGIGKKHLEFRFDSVTKIWSMFDQGSVNGTYFLLKNLEEYRNKKYSGLYGIFDEVKPGAFKTLLVGRYIFFLVIN